MDTTQQSTQSGEASPTAGRVSSQDETLRPVLEQKMLDLGARLFGPASMETSPEKLAACEAERRIAQSARLASLAKEDQAREVLIEGERRASLWRNSGVPKRHQQR